MNSSLNVILFQFTSTIDEIYGVYLDATTSFLEAKSRMEAGQQYNSKVLGLSIEHLDTLPHLYGTGEPFSPNSTILHECTQKEYRERHSIGGKNFIVLGNLCVSQLYQYWEDHYRALIAQCIKKEKGDISSDLFGDLRWLRNSIIHNGGVAISDIEKCKIISWFKKGQVITFTPKQIKEIIFLVKSEIDSLAKLYCC